jgi:hypothetical protein
LFVPFNPSGKTSGSVTHLGVAKGSDSLLKDKAASTVFNGCTALSAHARARATIASGKRYRSVRFIDDIGPRPIRSCGMSVGIVTQDSNRPHFSLRVSNGSHPPLDRIVKRRQLARDALEARK